MARQFLFGSPTDVLVKESSSNSMTDYFFPWTTNFNQCRPNAEIFFITLNISPSFDYVN